MSSTRRRIRSRSSRFLGALMGALVFLLFVAVTGGLGSDPTSNFNILKLVFGLVIVAGLGAWFFPWLQNRFSARYMRQKTLYQLHTRSGRTSSSRSRSRNAATIDD